MKYKVLILIFFLFGISIASKYCPILCDICDLSNNNYCSSCYNSFYNDAISMFSTTGTCSCTDGFYLNSTSQICYFCPITCATCDNYTTCTSCIAGYRIDNNKQCIKRQSNDGQWISMDVAYDLTTQKLLKTDLEGFFLINYVVSSNISNTVRSCSGLPNQPFFGLQSFDYDTQIIKSYFGLPFHDWLQIRFQFVAADKWTQTDLVLQVNGESYKINEMQNIQSQQIKTLQSTKRSRNFCLLSTYPDNLGIVKVYLRHKASMLKLRIRTSLFQRGNVPQGSFQQNVYFGIRQVFVRVGTCPSNCLICNGPNNCLKCKNPYFNDEYGQCLCDDTKGYKTQNNKCIKKCSPGFIFANLPSTSNLNIRNFNQSRCVLCSQVSDSMKNCFSCFKNNLNAYQCQVCLQGYFLHNSQCVGSCPSQYQGKTKNKNYIVNGDFKDTKCNDYWCHYNINNNYNNEVNGWIPDPQLEIGSGMIYSDQLTFQRVLELDPNHTSCVKQILPNLRKDNYNLIITHGARKAYAANDSMFNVKLNSDIIFAYNSTDYALHTSTTPLTLPDLLNSPVLRICGLGISNAYGAFIRQVKLIRQKKQKTGQCIKCPFNCKICKQEICIQCKDNNIYHQFKCISDCPSGTYLSEKRCMKCKQQCLTCTSRDVCTSCKSALFYLEQGKCIPECKNKKNCPRNCHPSCDQCYGVGSQKQCMSCKDKSKLLQNSTCVTSCSQGYFNLDNKRCMACNFPCKTCMNYENCLSCEYSYILNNQKCIRQCPANHYTNQKNICIRCSQNCLQCSGQSSCKQCANGFILLDGNCIISTQCQSAYYFDQRINKCVSCPQNCTSCYKDLCYECDSLSVLDNGKCQQQCNVQKVSISLKKKFENGTIYSVKICKWKDPLCNKYQLNTTTQSYQCTQCIFMNPYLVMFNDSTVNRCLFSCPVGTVKVQSNNIISCTACPSNCLSCSSNFTCVRCDTNYVVNPIRSSPDQCLSSCPDNYVSDGYQCLKCRINCKRCEVNGRCLECASPHIVNGNNDCVPDLTCGYYQYKLAPNICAICATGCVSCASVTQCSSCDYVIITVNSISSIHNAYLKQTLCLTDCGIGYYNISSPNLCIKCSSECVACVSQTQCTRCTKDYYLLLHPIQRYANISIGTCVPQCPFGYYNYNPINSQQLYLYSQCKFCSPNCLTCYGPSEDQCLSCYGTFKIDHNSRCVQNCPFNKYQDTTGHCDWCHQSCTSCTGPAQYQCKLCHEGSYLYRNKCYNYSCPGSTYMVDYDSRICQQCQWGCQVCTSPFNCSVCTGGFYLYEGWCYLKCPQNTSPYIHLQTAAYRCGNCTQKWSNCLQCSSTECKRCNNNYYLITNVYNWNTINSSCVTTCPIGYYGSISSLNRRCILCPSNCASCTDEQTCKICISGYVLTNNLCSQQCPVGKFFSNSPLPAKCSNCSADCLSCVSLSKCTNCNNNYYLMLNTSSSSSYCIKECGLFYYQDYRSGYCMKCSYACVQCVSYENCTRCITGKILKNGYCYDNNTNTCNITNCNICFNNNTCELCKLPYLNYIINGDTISSKCVLQCPVGYYNNNGRSCDICNSTCTSCYDSVQNCTSCQSGYYLYQQRCWSQCPIGYYKHQLTRQCNKCNNQCYECVSQSKCTKCINNYYLYQNKCVKQCPQSTYKQALSCMNCSDTCKVCKNNNYCIQCKSTYVKMDTKCIATCPDGYYLNQQQRTCYKCQYPCNRCLSKTQCINCQNGFIYSNKLNKCIDFCQKGYYIKNTASRGLECIKCSQNCQNCFNQTYCVSCNNNFYLFNGTCQQKCPLGHYSDNNNLCKQCSPFCLICNQDNCVQCHNSTLYYQKKCVSFCPPGTFKANEHSSLLRSTISTCKRCIQPCLTCKGNSRFNCQSCIDNYYKYKNYCVQTCPQGYFNNIKTKQCEKCSSGCKKCTSQQTCTQCQSNSWILQPTNQCKPNNNCTQSNCEVCQYSSTNNNARCYKCIKPYYLIDKSLLSSTVSGSLFDCVIDCPVLFYKSSNYSCLKCPQNCTSCYQQSCYSCKNGFYLYQNICVLICPNGYMANSITLQCTPNICLYKNSLSECQKCLSPYLLYNSSCVSTCPSGYYSSEGICKNCMSSIYNCLNCININKCISCNTGYFLFEDKCINSCPSGYYKMNQTCFLCMNKLEGCLDCVSNTKCHKCVYPYNLFNDTCIIECPINYYPTVNQQCKLCEFNCIKCTNQTQCTKCNNNTLRLNGDCLPSCPIGYYKLIDTNNNEYICNKCSYNCISCSNTMDNCTKCITEFNLLTTINNNNQNVYKCIQNCPIGYYQHINSTCLVCNIQCLTCNYQSCLSCAVGKYLLKGRCLSSCPQEYYSMNSVCQLCDSSCKACNLSSSNCISCEIGYILTSTNKCVSNCSSINLFYDPITYSCYNCSLQCSTCYGPRYDQCISCHNPFILLNSKCFTKCPQGYYKSINNICKLCDTTKCQSCTNMNDNCTSCLYPLVLIIKTDINNNVIGQCNINCGMQYFYNSTIRKCIPCLQNCLSCIDSNKCTLCKQTYFKYADQCVSTCPQAMIQIVQYNQRKCVKCPYNCKLCTNSITTSSIECTQCINPYLLYNGECYQKCPQKTYLQISLTSNTCQSCPIKCSTCIDSTKCTDCVFPYILHQNTCVQKCPVDYYLMNYKCYPNKYCQGYTYMNNCYSQCPIATYIDTINLQCLDCPMYCNKCLNSTYCLQCKNGFFLIPDISTNRQSCSIDCPSSTYLNNIYCVPCPSPCEKCSITPTLTYCITCINGYYLVQGKCLSSCPSNYYLSSSNNCIKCDSKCLTCDMNGCINCLNTYYNPPLCNSSNIICTLTQYISTISGNCVQCSPLCKECFGPTSDQCKSCKNISSIVYYLLGTSCILKCPESYIQNPITNTCQKCMTMNCKSCSLSNISECTSCVSGYILYRYANSTTVCIKTCSQMNTASSTFLRLATIDSCVSCESEISNCLQCYFSTSSNSTICSVCKLNYNLFNNQCVNPCPSTTYNLNNICYPCPKNCLTCSDANTCTVCNSPYVLYSGQCLTDCPLQFYNSLNSCVKCADRCLRCNSTGCINCVSPYKLTVNNQCTQCMNGYYMNNLLCYQCNPNCQTCSNANTCLTCKNPFILFGSQCVTSCPIDHYIDTKTSITPQCTLCTSLKSNCMKCTQTLGCTTCQNTYYLYKNPITGQTSCELTCPNGYFTDNLNMICVKCTQLNCIECSNIAQCNKCADNYYVYDSTNCVTQCPFGYAPGIINTIKTCIKCKQNCLQCSPTIDTCVTCENNFQNDGNGKCTIKPNTCPNGHYLSPLNICMNCQSSCLTCYGPLRSNCVTCRTPQYLLQTDGTCKQICPYGQYYSISDTTCKNCSLLYGSNCVSCDSTKCFICSSGKLAADAQSCISSCAIGSYEYNGICMACPVRCKSCNSSTYCFDCLVNTDKIYNNLCYDTCPIFTYTALNGSCQSCDSKCITCTGSSTNCTSCKNPYILQNSNTCVTQCSPGYYNFNNQYCYSCLSPCATCSNTGTNCTSCLTNYYLYQNMCTTTCPPGYYQNNLQKVCQSCQFPCQTCLDIPTKCQSCATGYVHSSSTNSCMNQCNVGQYYSVINNVDSCVNCTVSNCKKCDSIKCYQCQSNYFAIKNINGQITQCLLNCPSSYYNNYSTFTCQKCQIGCIQCRSNTQCQKCDTNYYLYQNKCVTTCPVATYAFLDSYAGNNCQQCNHNCHICIDITMCTQCSQGFYLYNKICVTQCPLRYFMRQIDHTCQQCSINCFNCSSVDICNRCDSGYTLINNQCVPDNCVNCDQCDYTATPPICTNCTSPYFLYKNRCIQQCPLYYYQLSNGTKRCQKCVDNCIQCKDTLSCTLCIPDYVYIKDTNKCQNEAVYNYGAAANMSGFTSNITETMATIYLSTSVGPVAFGQMSNTYFNIQFTQFLFFHQGSSGGNKQMNQFLSSLQRMSFTSGGTTTDSSDPPKQQNRRRLQAKTQYTDSFITVNAPIFFLMFSFLAAYVSIYLFQRFITQTCRVSCNNVWFYADAICTFMQKRFKWIYFDFIMWMSYLPFLYFALIQLQQFSFADSSQGFSSLLAIVIIGTYPLYPVFICYLLKKSYNQICIDPQQQQIKQTLTEMSLSPYLNKVKRPQRDYIYGQENIKLFSFANFRLMYYPLKYLRKFIFVLITALIADPITSVSILIGLNVLFIGYMFALRPRTMPYLVFDLIIQFVLLAFEIFLFVYLILDGSKIAMMSIVTHAIGFIFANISLIVAIILNLVAYYNIFLCIKDLLAHIAEKAAERKQSDNNFEIQKKFLDPHSNLYIQKDVPKFKGIGSDDDTDQDDDQLDLSQIGRKLADGLGQKQLLLNGIDPIKYVKKITKGQNFQIQQKDRALKLVNQDDVTDSDDSQMDQNTFQLAKQFKLNQKNLALNKIHPVKFAKQLTKDDAQLQKRYKKFDQKHVDKRIARIINDDDLTDSDDQSIDQDVMNIAKKLNLNEKQLAMNNINPVKFFKDDTKKDAPLQQQYKKFDQKHIDKRLAKVINEDNATDSQGSQIDQDMHDLAKKLQLNQKQLAFNQINPVKFFKQQTKIDAPLQQQYKKFDQKNMDKKLVSKINQQQLTDSEQDDQIDQRAHQIARKMNLNQKQLAVNNINPIKFFKDQTKKDAPLKQVYQHFNQKNIDKNMARKINDDGDTDSNDSSDSDKQQAYRLARDLKLDQKQLAANNLIPMKLVQNQAKKDQKLNQIKRKFDQKDIDFKVARMINDNGQTSSQQDSDDSQQNQKIVVARQLKLNQKQLAINNINPMKMIKQATKIDPQTNQPKINILKSLITEFSLPKKKLLDEDLQQRNLMKRELSNNSGTDSDQADQNVRLSKNTRNKLQNMSQKQMMLEGLDPKKVVKQLTKQAITKKMMDKKSKQNNQKSKRFYDDQIPDFKATNNNKNDKNQNKQGKGFANMLKKSLSKLTQSKKNNLRKSHKIPSSENINMKNQSNFMDNQAQMEHNLAKRNKQAIQNLVASTKNNNIGPVKKNMMSEWDDHFEVIEENKNKQIKKQQPSKVVKNNNVNKKNIVPSPQKIKLVSSYQEQNLNSQQSSQMALNTKLNHRQQDLESIEFNHRESSKNISQGKNTLNIDLNKLNGKQKGEKSGRRAQSSKIITNNPLQKTLQSQFFDQFQQQQIEQLGKVQQKKIIQKKYKRNNESDLIKQKKKSKRITQEQQQEQESPKKKHSRVSSLRNPNMYKQIVNQHLDVDSMNEYQVNEQNSNPRYSEIVKNNKKALRVPSRFINQSQQIQFQQVNYDLRPESKVGRMSKHISQNGNVLSEHSDDEYMNQIRKDRNSAREKLRVNKTIDDLKNLDSKRNSQVLVKQRSPSRVQRMKIETLSENQDDLEAINIQ